MSFQRFTKLVQDGRLLTKAERLLYQILTNIDEKRRAWPRCYFMALLRKSFESPRLRLGKYFNERVIKNIFSAARAVGGTRR